MATNIHKGKTHIFTARDGSENPIITLKAGQGETLNIEGLSAGGGSLVAYGDIDTVSIGTATSNPFTQDPIRDLSLKGACALGDDYFTCEKNRLGFVRYIDGVYDDFYRTDNSNTGPIASMSIYDSIAVVADTDDTGILEKSGGTWANPTYNPASSGENNLVGGNKIDCIQGYVITQPFNTPQTLNIHIKGSTIADTWDIAPTVQVALGATITSNQINSTAIYVCYGADKISIRDHDTGAETDSISLVGANLLAVNDTYILCTVGSVVYAYLVSDNSLINSVDTSDTIVDIKINKATAGRTAIYTTATEQFVLFYSTGTGTWQKDNTDIGISNASNSVAITDTKIMCVDPLTVQTASNSEGTSYFSPYQILQESNATIGYVKAVDNVGIQIKNDGILAFGPINTIPIPAASSSSAQITCFSAGFEESVIDTLESTQATITTLSSTTASATNLTTTTATITTGNITTINSTTINNAQTITANNAVCTTSLTTPVINGVSNILTIPDIVKVTDTTDSTAAATGSLQVTGGAAIAKNLYVGELIEMPTLPLFRATRTSSQTISNTTSTTIVYNSASLNQGLGNFNISTGQFTCGLTGYYKFDVITRLDCTSTGWGALNYVRLFFIINTSTGFTLFSGDPSAVRTSQDDYLLSSSFGYYINSGDVCEIKIFVDGASSASNLMVVGGTSDYFSGYLVNKNT